MFHVFILWLVVWIGNLQSGSSQVTTCYYGWTEFSGQCYYFSDSMRNRDEAIEDCKSRGDSNLVTVANQDVDNFLYDNRSSSEPYWIGLRPFDDNSWGWNDGRIDQLIAWHNGRPSNSSACGVFWSDVPAFYTHKCNDHRQYICESDEHQSDSWSQYNGHWYTVIRDTATQPEAANYCITLGGYLARLTTSDEMVFVSSLTSGHLWVGLTSLVWDDGTAYNWNNWVDNVPIPYSPCAVVDSDTGRWRLNDCHNEHYFICSHAPQLQIYTEGGSKENRGDPCVFPFIFHGTVYYRCTTTGHTKLWCSTKHGFDVDNDDLRWGNCILPTVSVTPSTIKTSTPTSALVATTTQTPMQTTIGDTVSSTNKFSSYSQTTFVPSSPAFESTMSRDITENASSTQEIADLSKSQEYNVVHIVLGVVFGIAAVVIISLLAAIYWKLRTKASENRTESLQIHNEETGNHCQDNNGYCIATAEANIGSDTGESGGYQALNFGNLENGETFNYGTDNNGYNTATCYATIRSHQDESGGYGSLDFEELEDGENKNYGPKSDGYYTTTTEVNIESHVGESGGYQALDFGVGTK